MNTKMSWLFHLLFALHIPFSIQSPVAEKIPRGGKLPEKVIAGVNVVDTPIVRAAQALALEYSSAYLYKHVMRSWLFGALILSHNETLKATVDLEVHALAALLHDLGLPGNYSTTSPYVTSDRRFEVDGAFAATGFVQAYLANNTKNAADAKASGWDAHRLQLLWDAIALHSEHKISIYKESSVAVTTNGIFMEFFGTSLGPGVTPDEYAAVAAEFPMDDLLPGFNQSMIWLCVNKPVATYDTWQETFGEHFVANYSDFGSRAFDMITGQ